MLLCLSIDHRSGSFSLLERLAAAETATLESESSGSVLLATCNRFELYLDLSDDAGAFGVDPEREPGALAMSALDSLAFAAGIDPSELRSAVRVFGGSEMAQHLFSVTAGLESAVVGEEEIAGQVRRAHVRARGRGTVTDRLERLFQAAARVSRDVTQRTGVRAAGRSLVGVALRMIEHRMGDWAEARALLVGTGAYAGATVAALRERGVQRLAVHSPSGRAERFARERGLSAIPVDGLAAAVAESDLIVTCSRVDAPVLLRAHFEADACAGGPLDTSVSPRRQLIDLGLPRNIDPAVAGLSGVELLDLPAIGRRASAEARGAETEAAALVRAAAAEFAAAQAERDAVPALLSLRGHVLTILEDELCRARRDSPAEVERALRRLAGRLLHDPTTRIKALGRQGRSSDARDALAVLFGI